MPYTGPSVRDMIQSHTLADQIIHRHYMPQDETILDQSELDLLQRWARNPTAEERIAIMQENGIQDDQGGRVGDKAASQGSLVGFCIVRSTEDNPPLNNAELERLKRWFDIDMREIVE